MSVGEGSTSFELQGHGDIRPASEGGGSSGFELDGNADTSGSFGSNGDDVKGDSVKGDGVKGDPEKIMEMI